MSNMLGLMDISEPQVNLSSNSGQNQPSLDFLGLNMGSVNNNVQQQPIQQSKDIFSLNLGMNNLNVSNSPVQQQNQVPAMFNFLSQNNTNNFMSSQPQNNMYQTASLNMGYPIPNNNSQLNGISLNLTE
jgi:hypothetical protein